MERVLFEAESMIIREIAGQGYLCKYTNEEGEK